MEETELDPVSEDLGWNSSLSSLSLSKLYSLLEPPPLKNKDNTTKLST